MSIWHCGVAEDGTIELCSEDVCPLEVGVGEIGAEEHRPPALPDGEVTNVSPLTD